jgi:hypothetical protein
MYILYIYVTFYPTLNGGLSKKWKICIAFYLRILKVNI